MDKQCFIEFCIRRMYWYQKQSKTKRGESFVKCNFGVPVVVLKVEKVIFATNFKPLNAVM